MRIIDAHCHIYPPAIAAKAVKSIARFYGYDMGARNGTPEQLLEEEKKFGVERMLVCSVATTREQVEHINDFVALSAEKHKEFVPFATLHPDMSKAEIEHELERIAGKGFKGIKLHPDSQGFAIDGKDGHKILECLDGKLPVLVHAGDKRFHFDNPSQIASVAKDFEHIRFVAAHFGGHSEWEKTACYKGLDNVWYDTSSTTWFIANDKTRVLVDQFGPDRLMFGTDYPMWDFGAELDRFLSLGLDGKTQDKILYGNAAAFFGE